MLDNKGHLYGTTPEGGIPHRGNIYEINPTGAERSIYSFTGGSDGACPYAGLISDSAGNLYGVADEGGDLTCDRPYGCGTVFKFDTSHNLSVLHVFNKNEGYGSYSNLVRDRAGNLYGSLYNGHSGNTNFGLIYKLDPLGNLTVLHEFSGGADGAYPNGLIIDDAGNLYGTTYRGGTHSLGTVFKVDPAGHKSILYNFAGGNEGAGPSGVLARDSAGNVYGVTEDGGDPTCKCGTVFRLNLPTRAETVLHIFTGDDGEFPSEGLILDSAGNLYGTTFIGGLDGGVVFMLDPNGVYSVLHEFTGPPDGSGPSAGLTMDRAGNLYGTTCPDKPVEAHQHGAREVKQYADGKNGPYQRLRHD